MNYNQKLSESNMTVQDLIDIIKTQLALEGHGMTMTDAVAELREVETPGHSEFFYPNDGKV